MKIIFLHIPKTAGQSTHAALVDAFGEDAVCPARVNAQLRCMSINELNRYKVFSGHLDWSLLDCLKGEKCVFTILREPMDRILSFYFFLRDQAENMPVVERNRPENQGVKAAFESNPREYFMGSAPHLRSFIDDHFDNFYTYYFAGKRYSSRSEIVNLINMGKLTYQQVLQMAKYNLAFLDKVFTVNRMSEVFSFIRAISGKEVMSDEKYRVNINNKVAAEDRRARIQALGADAATLARLDEYCRLDNELWMQYFKSD